MNMTAPEVAANPEDIGVDAITKIAILAVGGQGGGVLKDWIVSLAQCSGYDIQATMIAGVAQRTGSTVYYIEMLPVTGRQPVFSLAPVAGDVDIVVAAELMEAGRAITRGFVTSGKTKLLLSTHRDLATQEKIAPGNGEADRNRVIDAVRQIVPHAVAFDMHSIAEAERTVISAALFGAIAGAGLLPFETERFRDTIRATERGVAQSLAAFERARTLAAGEANACKPAPMKATRMQEPHGPAALTEAFADLWTQVEALPEPARETTRAGLRKLADFQDVAYADEYLQRLIEIAAADRGAGGAEHAYAFTVAAAKHLANAMAYDDIIRVADAKTKVGRFDRIAAEIGATSAQVIRLTEYTHPGAAEVLSLMPLRLGLWARKQTRLVRTLDRWVNHGRRTRTDRIGGFLSLYLLAGLRRWRRSLLRHAEETEHIRDWLCLALERLPADYAFAVETLNCRRLIKGYGDTHDRGLSRFSRVMTGAALVADRADASDWTRRLLTTALADPEGRELDGVMDTIRSFTVSGESGISTGPQVRIASSTKQRSIR